MNDQKLPSNSSKEDFLESLGQAPLFVVIHDKMKQLEDLPDELIQNVLNFLELPDLLSCGLVSKRIRSVSFIESLWQKIDISNSGHSRKIVPTDLVKSIINRGCKSLNLRGCNVTGRLKRSDFRLDSNYRSDQDEKNEKKINQIKSKKKLRTTFDSSSDSSLCESKYEKRKYLVEQHKTKTKIGTCQLISLNLTKCDANYCVMYVLLTACHSLKKLSLRKVTLTPHMFKIICNQNGRTLQTLDLTFTHGSNNKFLPRDMLLIVKNCIRLKEVDFSGCRLSKNCVELLVNNLSPNVEKLGLGAFCIDAEDKHIEALVSRCNKITSLNLACRDMLTDRSLTSIMENLKYTLEVLDIDYCQNITNAKLIEMRSMTQLKVLNYSMPQEHYEKLKMHLPQLTNNNFWRQKWMDLLEI